MYVCSHYSLPFIYITLRTPLCTPKSLEQYYEDYHECLNIIDKGPVKSLAYYRLQLLESKFSLHQTLNKEREAKVSQKVPHRDFYNVRKVDTHVHHSVSSNIYIMY